MQARTAGVGIRVVAVEAAFVERGQADVVALVGVACAYRKAGGYVVILGLFGINFAVIVRACRNVPAFGQRPFFLCAELVVDGGSVDRLGKGPVAVCAAAGGLVDVLFTGNAQAGIEFPRIALAQCFAVGFDAFDERLGQVGFCFEFVELVGGGFVLLVFKQSGGKLPADDGGIGVFGDKLTVIPDGFFHFAFVLGNQAVRVKRHVFIVSRPLFVNRQDDFDARDVA